MFGAEFFGSLIGFAVALLMAPIHLTLQMQSRDLRFNWREPLVFSLVITAATAFVVAVGGIINGEAGGALRDAGAMLVPMFPLIAAGSFAGRGAGWMLQRLRDRL